MKEVKETWRTVFGLCIPWWSHHKFTIKTESSVDSLLGIVYFWRCSKCGAEVGFRKK